MALDVAELIARLDDPSAAGEDAKAELIALGAAIVPELAARVATLHRFGKLSAIEIFEALSDPRACPALVSLLTDDADTVVEWSATALGTLGCHGAVAALRGAYARCLAARVLPSWTGPTALRQALTDLGARRPVVPELTAQLLLPRSASDLALIRSTDLPAVIDDLAAHDQVILGFTLWRISTEGTVYGATSDHAEWTFDWAADWVSNVAAARQAAHEAARTVATNRFAHVEWITRTDLSA